jgi:hypothetical protein
VDGGEDDLVGGDDDGEELGGELQHRLVLKHDGAANLEVVILSLTITHIAIFIYSVTYILMLGIFRERC